MCNFSIVYHSLSLLTPRGLVDFLEFTSISINIRIITVYRPLLFSPLQAAVNHVVIFLMSYSLLRSFAPIVFFFITNTSKKTNRCEGGVGWGCIIWHCNLTRILFGDQIVWQIKFRLTIAENKKKEKSFWWTPSNPLRVHKLLFWLLLTGFYILSDVHWKIFQWLLETSSSWFLVGLATCDWYPHVRYYQPFKSAFQRL